ncbi:phosphatidylinositol 3-root isoform [Cryptosporidium ubiquitum]|uniref:Phosphatidylinositol 3-root isoform n=1 Tax=Cryptosporidium ubiquitum TaxID=857276 RepID=A0A1J4MFQ7_9CRYT|nr:phosphatidylinositol 3-root isoform [Cryptosporidium ubiquitum]OII73070.1 phosphatidylinositol 3-root isoform [Cryptosporidium ubiquitum]
MNINIDYIAFSFEKIESKYSFMNMKYFPVALRIHCEQYLINSSGKIISDNKTAAQSQLIIIEKNMNKKDQGLYTNFEINMSIHGEINLSSFCNYTNIYIFKLLDENYLGSEEFIIGYSILLLNSAYYHENVSSIDLPILINCSEIFQEKLIYDINTQIYEILFLKEKLPQDKNHLNKVSNNLLGYLHLTLNFGEKMNFNPLIGERNISETKKLINCGPILNTISDYIDLSNTKVSEQRIDFTSLINNKRSLFDNFPYFSIDNSLIKNYFLNKEILELEKAINKLYIGYLTRLDNANMYENEFELIWKYRLYLIKFKAGIPMLLHFANLNDKSIMIEIDNLINWIIQTIKKPMNNCKNRILNIEDSLNLLSREYKEFLNIRKLAVENLEFYTKDELFLILPQLVQSLRYENGTNLMMLLKRKAMCDLKFCVELFWLLISEISTQEYPKVFEQTIYEIIEGLADYKNYNINGTVEESYCCKYHFCLEMIDLILCQIQFRATLLWIHRISVEDCKRERAEKKIQKFRSVLNDFELGKIPHSQSKISSRSTGIDKITVKLISSMKVMLEVENEFANFCSKKKNLISLKFICNYEFEHLKDFSLEMEEIELPLLNITNLSDLLLLPIDVNRALIGIVPSESFIIKSSQCPIILSCRMAILNSSNKKGNVQQNMPSDDTYESESIYPVVESKYMYKVGDDLRQDRLVIQLLEISYNLLNEWNAKSSAITYKVTPFSQFDGLIEFLEDFSSIGSIRKKYGKNCILNYWAGAYNTNINNIPHNVLATFINSCAAYSVVTFILGVGDRHLDNLLVGKNGHFLHVDFGYIFGEDPKPFPPPMKICSEMIEAMGGLNSSGFKLFVDKCCDCYRYIRRNSWLISNILLLMVDSGIKDLNSKPENNYAIILERIKEKFRLEQSEREAERYLREIIMTSSNALFPAVVDTLHDWALYWA